MSTPRPGTEHGNDNDNDRMERGLRTLRRIEATERPGILDGFQDVAPGFGELVVGFAFGDICSRPGLELPTRQLVTVAALTALGNAAPQLEFHVRGARNVGCDRREIVETVLWLSGYAGFPATLKALGVVRSVFAAEATAEAAGAGVPSAERSERGLRTPRAQGGDGGVCEQVLASVRALDPALADDLVESAFGPLDPVTSRGGLDPLTRAIVSVAACTALGTLRPQLTAQVHAILDAGGTPQDAVETILQMAVYAGVPAAVNGLNAARDVFRTR
ncbi:carboxymuconolactone decarboxylase family protein [Streptomyces kutzneri]|uniref:carboxymuconolactone decarboxylase family protein n=1 Tax=Streptomyces kutzneri TaxID=3051179 RepID=UPI0028D706B2|nr:carboxymuconolactone decarboxylase family protein [Streptomyces sp. DSM 40907]